MMPGRIFYTTMSVRKIEAAVCAVCPGARAIMPANVATATSAKIVQARLGERGGQVLKVRAGCVENGLLA